jgi:GxxExxY protein
MSGVVNELLTKADPISRTVIGAAIEVHRALGPGLLESACQACLAQELMQQGIRFMREVPLPVSYKGVQLDCGYRMDFVVEDRVVFEVKTVESLQKIHEAQLLTYLRLGRLPLGFLLNFHAAVLRDGIKRLAL